ncbi:MAG: hydantoinase B/oxoprolinase family protein [Candidatus Obscuribacterales bacterium]|nr:hydantoinase B/oxoprolinase family protein [Candidatus Obscuribacterales bacterium]
MKDWQFWIDRGGTFTDIIARLPDGRLLCSKRLSESADGLDPALCGIKEILNSESADLSQLGLLRMGTTLGTNALLERKGARTVFVCTKGFADAVRIAYQNRPDIFALEIKLPEMIFEELIEFDERLSASGELLIKPDLESLRIELKKSFDKGIRSCAIALMHAYKFPQHEKLARSIAADIGFKQISVSNECAALMKLISRADTTLVDAYLTPILKEYIEKLESSLKSKQIFFMQSNGGLAQAGIFRGKDSIVSGPAGGLLGAIKVARACGFQSLISFDMGGTSTDVSHFAGDLEHIYDAEIAGMRIRAPMMDIHTVAAGGGSVLSFDGSRYRVGPDSAGANPGPLSYRRNGPLTLTDANLLLGRIQPDYFPRLFGPKADEALDLRAVQRKFEELSAEIQKQTGDRRGPEEVAYGFIKIAVAKMANAIKHVSVQRGHDLRDCVLICFGGAGAQHACLIAEELGMSKILIHPLAGLLSAYGIGLAETRLQKELEINEILAQCDEENLNALIQHYGKQLSDSLCSSGISLEEQKSIINAHISMAGSDYSLPVRFSNKSEMRKEFLEKHKKRYGFIDQQRELLLSQLSIQVLGENTELVKNPLSEIEEDSKITGKSLSLYTGEKRQECPLFSRAQLKVGDCISGPALITETNTTTVLDPGWKAEKLEDGSLLLSNTKALSQEKKAVYFQTEAAKQSPDPVLLELFNNLFSFIAEQMGLTLQNTSHSVNIKERLDFSCALFDAEGNLVANAPHIPVHLGSMGESVKSLIFNAGSSMQAGDAYANNDPYNGGTHLPDITIISPFFDDHQKEILFFVASRGHHADIGGISPGSMPAESSSIEEEGVLFQNELVMRQGEILQERVRELLYSAGYPARNPEQNLADLKAQLAANNRGIEQLKELISKWGKDTVLAYMQHVQDNAEACVRKAIRLLSSGSSSGLMDDGSRISVEISIDKENACAFIDFSGTSEQSKSNFNAPLAVCKAAVLYVFRTLVRDEIPLNAGCFRPLVLKVPQGCLLNPLYPAPVVAGNVETSQAIVDQLYAALGIMAASQGGMNNLSFGNEKYQYYETICGGTGAGAAFDGAGPVQSHMTNSRLTDPEVLESRFPVLLESFAIRKGSGGEGKHKGGDGALRRIRFLEKMSASILSNHRTHGPAGLFGGKAGLPGRNLLIKADGSTINLGFRASFELEQGDCLQIETPGGGGFGAESP